MNRNIAVAKTLILPAIEIAYWGHLFSTVTPGLFVDRLYNIAQALSQHRQLTDEWLEDARLVQVSTLPACGIGLTTPQVLYDVLIDDNVGRYFSATMEVLSDKVVTASEQQSART